ncbi:MAG: 2-oxo acid dehydrogenase subunit E2 [Anaerolineales bacterium]|nr:2-oxo acid dehydrogenase subunit E2 [Anaerolineales bacterium]
MATSVRMPQLGESVVEGTVVRWRKAPGDRVAKGEPLLDISTDKIDTEAPAPIDGVLVEIVVPEGVTVAAGTVLAYIGAPEDGETAMDAKRESGSVERVPPGATGSTGDVRPEGRAFVSPVVARMAAEYQVDLGRVSGTGMGGRITKKDLEAYIGRVTAQVAEEHTVIAPTVPIEAERPKTPVKLSADEVLHPLTAMRRAIAQHMVMSKRTSPHVTSICEADLTAVVHHREANKRGFAAKGVALTYTAYFVTAIATALRSVPEANSRFTDDGIVVSRRVHIGVAVALSHGLIVPIIRDADELNLQGVARAVNDEVARARSNQLRPEEIQGGTFTLTNHGTGGSLLATPIINQPQTGILGAGAIVKRPVVRSTAKTLLPHADDAIVIRPMVYLSLTFDHRALDGAQADAFLTVVRERLENWQ